jgi:HlyD family secretion protein
LKVPLSALFKSGENWRVFIVSNSRAVERIIAIGHRNRTEAEVLNGLAEGDLVVLYPNDKLINGTPVK